MEKEFVEMITDHQGIIHKICNLYMHKSESRRDLFQEIILQLWRSFPSFRNESQKSTWMYRVALNTAISNFRKERRMPESRSLSNTELNLPDMSEVAHEPEIFNLLNRAIEQLSAVERAIIMLYMEERSYVEISSIMGISQSNVGVKLNRIKLKLEGILKRD